VHHVQHVHQRQVLLSLHLFNLVSLGYTSTHESITNPHRHSYDSQSVAVIEAVALLPGHPAIAHCFCTLISPAWRAHWYLSGPVHCGRPGKREISIWPRLANIARRLRHRAQF